MTLMACRCGLGRRDYFAEMPAHHVLWHSRALLAAWIVSAIGICLQEGNMRTIRREACVSTQESVSLAKGHVLYMRLRDVLSSVQVLTKPLSSILFWGKEAARVKGIVPACFSALCISCAVTKPLTG